MPSRPARGIFGVQGQGSEPAGGGIRVRGLVRELVRELVRRLGHVT